MLQSTHYIIAGIVCAICSLPLLTKMFAEAQMKRTLQLTQLAQFQAIANSYTSNGTAEELQAAMESLEEVMEELKFLEHND